MYSRTQTPPIPPFLHGISKKLWLSCIKANLTTPENILQFGSNNPPGFTQQDLKQIITAASNYIFNCVNNTALDLYNRENSFTDSHNSLSPQNTIQKYDSGIDTTTPEEIQKLVNSNSGSRRVKRRLIRFTCPKLHSYFENLMIPGTITEFYGRGGSGKTQIGIDLVVSLLLHDLQNVNGDTGLRESYSAIVISTDKLFPINRLYKILSQNLPGFDGARIHEVMKNVLLFHIRDYETQVHVLRYHLKPLIHRYNVKLVVVDSITCNLRNLDEDEESLFQGTNKKIHMEKDGRMGFGGSQVINETGYLLRILAVEYNLVVVCLNQVVANMRKTFGYTEYNEDVDAALGLVWSNLITTRVKVERVDQGMVMDGESISEGRRYMKVIFSPCVGMDSVGFDVTDAGVFGYGE